MKQAVILSKPANDMKDSTFNRLRQIIRDQSGISLRDNKRALAKARISKRMRELGIDRYEDYLDHVIHDLTGHEVQLLLDVISTNVTSFYREAAHFEFMRSAIREWIKMGARSLRLWSCACSSGEEPYTMAIEVLEAVGSKINDIKILATDIAPSVLKTCLRGEYSENAIAPISKHLRAKYFIKRKEGGKYIYTVSEKIRKIVLCRHFNLNTYPFPLRGPLDIVFCRNVMIYFDKPIKSRIAEESGRLLKQGGYLFIGHAETLTGISTGFATVKPSIYMRQQ